jgi:hypothetical protein
VVGKHQGHRRGVGHRHHRRHERGRSSAHEGGTEPEHLLTGDHVRPPCVAGREDDVVGLLRQAFEFVHRERAIGQHERREQRVIRTHVAVCG